MSREIGSPTATCAQKLARTAAKLPRIRPNRVAKLYALQCALKLQRIVNGSRSSFMIVTAALVASLCACSVNKRGGFDETHSLSPRVVQPGEPVPKGGGVYKLGDPYYAGGRLYVPVNDTTYDQVGIASWYGDFFHGRRTANGEIYDMDALTAAHPTLPMPTYVSVTSLETGRTIIVRINDRGPYHDGRIIDLSHRAAVLLGIHDRGSGPVRVHYIGPAPLNGDDTLEQTTLARQPWAPHMVKQKQARAPSPKPQAVAAAKAPPPATILSAAVVEVPPLPAAQPAATIYEKQTLVTKKGNLENSGINGAWATNLQAK